MTLNEGTCEVAAGYALAGVAAAAGGLLSGLSEFLLPSAGTVVRWWEGAAALRKRFEVLLARIGSAASKDFAEYLEREGNHWQAEAHSHAVAEALALAMSQARFDCTGFSQAAFAEAGFDETLLRHFLAGLAEAASINFHPKQGDPDSRRLAEAVLRRTLLVLRHKEAFFRVVPQEVALETAQRLGRVQEEVARLAAGETRDWTRVEDLLQRLDRVRKRFPDSEKIAENFAMAHVLAHAAICVRRQRSLLKKQPAWSQPLSRQPSPRGFGALWFSRSRCLPMPERTTPTTR